MSTRVLSSLLAVLLVLCAGACDGLAPPEPTNPRDPAFEGSRIPSPPVNLRLVNSTARTVTLAWDPGSSFAEGYRIEVATKDLGDGFPNFSRFASLAIVPALGGTTYTAELPTTDGFRFRIVPLPAPASPDRPQDREGPPSEALTVEYGFVESDTSQVRTTLQSWESTRPQFNAEGTVFYTGRSSFTDSIYAIDATTGARLWEYVGPKIVLRVLRDGGVVAALNEDRRTIYRISPTGTLDGIVRLDDAECLNVFNVLFYVSEDGRRGVASCTPGVVRAWDLSDGAILETFAAPTVSRVLGVDTAGDLAFVQRGVSLAAMRLTDGEFAWTRTQALRSSKVVVSPGGRNVLVAEGGTVQVVEAQNGRSLASVTALNERPYPIGFGPDGTTAVYRDREDLVVAEARTLLTIQRFRVGVGPAQLPDGSYVAAGWLNGAVGLSVTQGEQFVRWDTNRTWSAVGE